MVNPQVSALTGRCSGMGEGSARERWDSFRLPSIPTLRLVVSKYSVKKELVYLLRILFYSIPHLLITN